jgi:MFS family permease
MSTPITEEPTSETASSVDLPNLTGFSVWKLFTERERLKLLFVLFLVSTSNYVDRNVLSVLIEPIKREYHASDTQMGLLTGLAFAMLYATLGIPIARLADRSNRKWLIAIAITVWSVMTMACGATRTFGQLVLARVGVGAGEAGAIPPAQSLLADYYPPDRRGWALGVFLLASTVGLVLGVSGGGWTAEHYGWRTTFIVAGLPGLVLALAVLLGLKEPRRMSGFVAGPEARESVASSVKALFSKPSYRNILISLVLYYFVAYGALIFTTSFVVRVHHLKLGQASSIFGLVAAVAGVVGSLFGGRLVDRLAKRSLTWLCYVPAAGLLVAWPLNVAVFIAPNIVVMMFILFLTIIVQSAVVLSEFAALHAVCGSGRRAMAVALAFFFTNLIGMGGGPVITGIISDACSHQYGSGGGLRIALMIMVGVFLPSSFFIWRAGRHMLRDAEG